MSSPSQNRYFVTPHQAEALHAAIFSNEGPAPPDIVGTPEPDNLVDCHLTDERFIQYAAYGPQDPNRLAIDAHIAGCEECAEEIARLRRLDSLWRDPADMRRLLSRVRTAADAGRAQHRRMDRSASGPQPFPLACLVLPEGAFAAGISTEPAAAPFRIWHLTEPVEDLRGFVMRREQSYYLRVDAAHDSDAKRIANKYVLVEISKSDRDNWFIQRKISVGVTVLLGTDLPLTPDSVVRARLLGDPEDSPRPLV